MDNEIPKMGQILEFKLKETVVNGTTLLEEFELMEVYELINGFINSGESIEEIVQVLESKIVLKNEDELEIINEELNIERIHNIKILDNASFFELRDLEEYFLNNINNLNHQIKDCLKRVNNLEELDSKNERIILSNELNILELKHLENLFSLRQCQLKIHISIFEQNKYIEDSICLGDVIELNKEFSMNLEDTVIKRLICQWKKIILELEIKKNDIKGDELIQKRQEIYQQKMMIKRLIEIEVVNIEILAFLNNERESLSKILAKRILLNNRLELIDLIINVDFSSFFHQGKTVDIKKIIKEKMLEKMLLGFKLTKWKNI